jgi:hypothetical protein
MSDLPPRTPWKPGFPNVLIHGDLAVRDAMPEYHEAKRGSAQDALRLARALVSDSVCDQLVAITRARANPVRLVAVTARERMGVNLIPDLMADVIARRTGLEADTGAIVQTNTVSHTRARSLQRIVTPAEFAGPVQAGVDYIVIDDHIGLGGTIANLKGWIEINGGRVIVATCLTASPLSEQLAIGEATRDMLLNKYGRDLNPFWKEHFGHGLDCLTDREGRALVQARAQSVDALAARLSEAAQEAGL